MMWASEEKVGRRRNEKEANMGISVIVCTGDISMKALWMDGWIKGGWIWLETEKTQAYILLK